MGRGDRKNKIGSVPQQTGSLTGGAATRTRAEKQPLSSKELLEREEDIKNFFSLCETQDWFFEFTEDHKKWQKGNDRQKTLEDQSKKDPLKAKILQDFKDHKFGPGKNLGSEPAGPKPELDSYEALLQDSDHQVEPVLCASCSKEIFEGTRMEFVYGFEKQGVSVGPYHPACKPTITEEQHKAQREEALAKYKQEKEEGAAKRRAIPSPNTV